MSVRCSSVYPHYDIDAPPEHPGGTWTRFVCISDTHSRTKLSVPAGDVLIHAGDLSSWGTLPYLHTTLKWLSTLPHEIKIIIAGNHDLCLDSSWKDDGSGSLDPEEVDKATEIVRSKAMREAGILYLDHEYTEITTSKGARWKVYGTPAAPFHVQGAFQYVTTKEAIEEWSQLPRDVEILVTHTPPFGVLDETRRGKHAGCQVLASRLNELPHCRLHVFGHIHEAHGAKQERRILTAEGQQAQCNDLVSVNAAVYHGTQPIIVDMKKDM